MQKILIATTNPAKVKEITKFLSDLPVEFVSLTDVGITTVVQEDGKTYEQNSQKKALQYSKLSDLPAISDDGGLEIAALGGKPGVQSKYWAGKEGKDEDIIAKMQKVSQELPDNNRAAQFIAVVSFALPNGKVWSKSSYIDLLVTKKPSLRYRKGFPFRSFLIIPKLQKYYHEEELTLSEQRTYNHRYKALMKLKKIIVQQNY